LHTHGSCTSPPRWYRTVVVALDSSPIKPHQIPNSSSGRQSLARSRRFIDAAITPTFSNQFPTSHTPPPGCLIKHFSLATPPPLTPYAPISITISSTTFQPCFRYNPSPFGEASINVLALWASATDRPSFMRRVPRPRRWWEGETQRRDRTFGWEGGLEKGL